jgi:hypothetical protein
MLRGWLTGKWDELEFSSAKNACLLGVALPMIILVFLHESTSALAAASVTTNNAGALVLTNHYGDLNDDGTVDVRDLVALGQHLQGTRPVSPALTNRLDLNQDGVGNADDWAILQDMIAHHLTKADEDFDADELANAGEVRRGTNPFLPDSDGDGWLDGWEVAEGTDPLNAQSGLKPFVLARPPTRVLSPLIQDVDTNIMVLARPPVRVVYPLIQDSDTNVVGTILARPPVTVTGPPN